MTDTTPPVSQPAPNGTQVDTQEGTNARDPLVDLPPMDTPVDTPADAETVPDAPEGTGTQGDLEEEPAAPLIEVSVRHGDLAYARYPVMVGHYLGDTIVSAEKALDQRLDGALEGRMRLGLYPGPPGSHALFVNQRPRGRPAGAIVVGLGQVGDLSPGLLEGVVRDALLDYALRLAEWPDDRFGDPRQVRSAALSCVLVGSGAGGMRIDDSLAAILRAALAATDKLVETGLHHRVTIDTIEFLELYQDLALAAAEALERVLTDGQLNRRIRWGQRVVLAGEGGQQRVRCEEAPDWWQRLEIIEDQGADALRFIASTDRARAEVTLATGQLRLADRFIAQASRSAATNNEAAKTLFEMLLPIRLRELMPRKGDLVLLVDEVSARFPWELLEDRWSQNGRPPAVSDGLVRQLKTLEYRPQPSHATAAKALIIGSPDLDGWNQYADLPGAREEAIRLAALLRELGFQVLDRIDAKADDILGGLHKDAWRILHLAGHGEHAYRVSAPPPASGCLACGQPLTPRQEPVSGMVIGKETFLTPGDVAQMRWVPELVFISCCHLGKTQQAEAPPFNRLAANLAIEFVRMGVKAVVAAGWAVDDRAGLAFAESFYTHMLGGQAFGEAVRAAREETWSRYPEVNTWGAYQCYGDPAYRLRGEGAAPVRPSERRYHAPFELVADLRNQTERIRMRMGERGEDPDSVTALRAGIEDRLADIPAGERDAWLTRADVAAALGFAWGEARDYRQAVAWLERSLDAGEGDCPLRAQEHYHSLRVRLVGEEWKALRDQPDDDAREGRRQDLVACIDQSILALAEICEQAPTADRLTLLGEACRYLAWLETRDRARLEALVNMARYYRLALDKAGGMEPRQFPHWVCAMQLVAQLDPARGGDWQTDLTDRCQRMLDLAAQRHGREPSFRNGLAEADNALALLLTRHAPTPAEVERVCGLYLELFRRGASPGEVASVHEFLDFLVAQSQILPAPLAQAVADIRASV